MIKNRILSGVQPTGNLHLGNYLGAIKNFVKLQKDYECYFMLADLHSITVFQDPKQLRENIIETAAVFLACGLDPKKNVIFCQSSVGGHSELAWIFNCVARIGWLNRMTQFKEKAGSNKEKASVGLYSYPTLMAADILLYKATHVPVGEDQKQHLELCRDIAVKFNNDFNCKDFFTLPEPIITKENIFSILNNNTIEKTLKELNGKNFSELKNKLSEALIKEIVPIGKKIKEFKKDTDAIKKILKSGSEKANIESQKTIKEVHKIVGLSLS